MRGWALLLIVGCTSESSTLDAGKRVDARVADAGVEDTGVQDEGVADTGAADTGLPSDCATAIARGRVAGSGAPWVEALSASPLDTIELDGSASTGAMGASIATYAWRVTAPTGSSSMLAPGDDVAMPSFFLDLNGEYVFSLEVTDGAGHGACAPAEVRVTVTPADLFHVQLVWNTPGDPDPTDQGPDRGTDLDVHLLHPMGSWGQAPYDCFSANASTTWGASLDIDDTDGWGPENINLFSSEATPGAPLTYEVGVAAFDDHGFGPSTATIRIYVAGLEALVLTSPEMVTGNAWHAARITWPTRQVEAVDTFYAGGFP